MIDIFYSIDKTVLDDLIKYCNDEMDKSDKARLRNEKIDKLLCE